MPRLRQCRIPSQEGNIYNPLTSQGSGIIRKRTQKEYKSQNEDYKEAIASGHNSAASHMNGHQVNSMRKTIESQYYVKSQNEQR